MVFVLVSLFSSLALVFGVKRIALGNLGPRRVIPGAGALTFLTLCLGMPALALQSLLTFISTIVCVVLRSKPQATYHSAIASMLIANGLIVGVSAYELYMQYKARSDYPLVSLRDRMSFEAGWRSRHPQGLHSENDVALSSLAEKQLADFEEQLSYNAGRARMLARLHQDSVADFILAQGFGPVRMLQIPNYSRIDLPEVAPIALPRIETRTWEHASSGRVIQRPNLPTSEGLQSIHDTGMHDLFDARRMGHVVDLDHVAGFAPHQFTRMPHAAQPMQWQITRLELISLLAHDPPVAYVSEHLPRMDELGEAATRPLDAFEAQSLSRLRTEESVVFQDDGDRIRMVGALRAANACLRCHFARRGELLGGLSYELLPESGARPSANPTEDSQATHHFQ